MSRTDGVIQLDGFEQEVREIDKQWKDLGSTLTRLGPRPCRQSFQNLVRHQRRDKRARPEGMELGQGGVW